MARLVLPDHLAVLQSGQPYIDVVGVGSPWVVPAGWWEATRSRVRALVNDPRAGATQEWASWPPDTRDAAPFLQNLAMALGGFVAIFSGEYAQFPEQLVEDYLHPEQRRETLAARNWYLTDSEWALFLLRYAGPDPTARRGALELSRDCTVLLSEVGPLSPRAQALLGVYDRVLNTYELATFHLQASYPEVVRLWRHALLTDAERAVLPEIAGWGAALAWSFEGLQAAHEHLFATTTGAETLAEVVASMALTDQVQTLPAGLAVAVGDQRFDQVNAAFDQRRPGFDGPQWLQDNRGWLARGLLAGEIDACRSWLAMAAQVSRLVAGLPGPPRASAAPDTLGFVADVEELSLVQRATNPLVETFAADRPVEPQPATPQLAEPRSTVEAADTDSEVTPAQVDVGDPQAELAALIGLEPVKEQVRRMVAEARADRLRQSAGMPVTDRSRHLVFIGNPGTAKTTVARLLARIYAELGLLASGHLVETGRLDLVGSYVGQTAPKARRVFDRASGGVLFVDEAYALMPEDSPQDFGAEAVATLLKLMEDRRDDVVVIVAGYPTEMEHFLSSNPGLASRFPKTLTFDDYTDDELFAIFEVVARQQGFVLGDGVEEAVRALFPAPRPTGFGNGRFVRNVFEEAVSIQAERIVTLEHPTPGDIRTLLVRDLPGDAPSGEEQMQGMYL